MRFSLMGSPGTLVPYVAGLLTLTVNLEICTGKTAHKHASVEGCLILTTQAWKQTLPPSDRILHYMSASVLL